MMLRRAVIVSIALAIVSPIFGLLLPEALQSEEYIEALADRVEPVMVIDYPAPLKEYSIHGLPGPVGYAISALVGYGAIVGLYYTIYRIAFRRRGGG